MSLLQRLSTAIYRSYLAKLGVAASTYALLLYISLEHLVPAGGSGASVIWPVAGLGIAILWFWGIELWPAIAIAFMVVLIPRGISPQASAITATGNVLESVIVVYLLRLYVGFSPMFSRLRDTLGLFMAATFASLCSATFITFGVYLINQRPIISTALWVGIFIGHFVSIISVGAFLLRWLYRPLFTKTSTEVIEGVAVFGSIFTLTVLMAWTPYSSIAGISLLYIAIIPLIWAALRTGPRGTTLALFIFTILLITGVLFGWGPTQANLSQTLFGIQMIVGVLSLIFLLFTSITEERKEAVLSLERHVGELEHALQKISSEDQAKSDFIAILAHELRNPLSPILSGLELLKEESKANEEVLRMMGAHLNTAARLLDDLLDISRISQKRFKLQKERVEIHDIIERTLEMVRPQLVAREHTLTTTLPQEEVWLSADPVRLSQVFVNLLNNAAKYTDPGGSLSLTVERRGAELVAVVRDNGVGIPPERMHKLFEPFGGGEPGGHRPGGLRIGLSLARRMAEMHQGTIRAQSPGAGKGSTFTVTLPLPPTMQLPLADTPKGQIRSRFSKETSAETKEKLGSLTILVVDDNEAAAEGLRKLLEHHGHRVRTAYDAPQGLSAAEAEQPDVAILDIGLPTMSGYDLAALMRQRFGKDLLLVALTGYGQSDDKQKAKAAGFNEHLVKPVSIADVQRVLLELTNRA